MKLGLSKIFVSISLHSSEKIIVSINLKTWVLCAFSGFSPRGSESWLRQCFKSPQISANIENSSHLYSDNLIIITIIYSKADWIPSNYGNLFKSIVKSLPLICKLLECCDEKSYFFSQLEWKQSKIMLTNVLRAMI